MRQNTSLIHWMSAGYLRISSGLGIFFAGGSPADICGKSSRWEMGFTFRISQYYA